jgi:hypothetical protein
MNKNIESMAPQNSSLGCRANYISTLIGVTFKLLGNDQLMIL